MRSRFRQRPSTVPWHMIPKTFVRKPRNQFLGLLGLTVVMALAGTLLTQPIYHARSKVGIVRADNEPLDSRQVYRDFNQAELINRTAALIGLKESGSELAKKYALRVAARAASISALEVEVWASSKSLAERWAENAAAALRENTGRSTASGPPAALPGLQREWFAIEKQSGQRLGTPFDLSSPQSVARMRAELDRIREIPIGSAAITQRLNDLGRVRVELQDPALDTTRKLELLSKVVTPGKAPSSSDPQPVEAESEAVEEVDAESRLQELQRQFEREYQSALEQKAVAEDAPVEPTGDAPNSQKADGSVEWKRRIDKLAQAITLLPNRVSMPAFEVTSVELIESGLQPGSMTRMRVFLGILSVGTALACAVPLALILAHPTFSDSQQIATRLQLQSLGLLSSNSSLRRAQPAPMDRGEEERINSIRNNLIAALADSETGAFLITSAVPQEGKTLLAWQLAKSLARAGHRTLLIDADLRRGRVHRLFGYRRAPGLREVLEGTATLEQTIRGTAHEQLSALTAGKRLHASRQWLGSPEFAQLLATLRERFEYIVLDGAPVLGLPDAALLQTHADAVAFVIRKDYAPARSIRAAIELLRKERAKLAGFVLHAVNESAPPLTAARGKEGAVQEAGASAIG